MIRLLFVSSVADTFGKMMEALQANRSVEIEQAGSGGEALLGLINSSADLVVVAEQLNDMGGLKFAEKLVTQNPMVSCALVSSLSEEHFHEASEGLGILAKLPVEPGEKEAADLLQKLKVIAGLGG